jgi:hypothetical protein
MLDPREGAIEHCDVHSALLAASRVVVGEQHYALVVGGDEDELELLEVVAASDLNPAPFLRTSVEHGELRQTAHQASPGHGRNTDDSGG